MGAEMPADSAATAARGAAGACERRPVTALKSSASMQDCFRQRLTGKGASVGTALKAQRARDVYYIQ